MKFRGLSTTNFRIPWNLSYHSKSPLPDGGQADFVSFEEQRKKDYELAELTKKKIQADLIKKFGV